VSSVTREWRAVTVGVVQHAALTAQLSIMLSSASVHKSTLFSLFHHRSYLVIPTPHVYRWKQYTIIILHLVSGHVSLPKRSSVFGISSLVLCACRVVDFSSLSSFKKSPNNTPVVELHCTLFLIALPFSVCNQRLLCWTIFTIFSERELTFTFAICGRPSVCLSVVCNVRAPYSGGSNFGNISMALGTLAIR